MTADTELLLKAAFGLFIMMSTSAILYKSAMNESWGDAWRHLLAAAFPHHRR